MLKLLRVSALVSVVAISVVSSPFVAGAQTILDAKALGFGEAVTFVDRVAEVAVPIPIPAGLSPQVFAATVQVPVNLDSGVLEAWSEDLLLARVPFTGAQDAIRVEIPLEAVRVTDAVADLSLRTVLTAGDEACADWTERPLVLRDSEVVYNGVPEVPRVLADFIPPVLQRLEIYLPDSPTPVEAEAAAELATTASARFGARGLEVEVLSAVGDRAPMASPFTRRVEIREAPDTRIELVDAAVPTVSITGEAATLARQARSVSTDLGALAVTNAVTVDSPLSPPRALMTEVTLNDLGIGSVTARSVGTVSAGFGLDQTRLAGVTGEVTLDLLGTYTPPPAGSSALVVLTVGDTIFDSWVADPSGTIDRTITIPAAALGRYTEVSVTLQAAGEGAACGMAQPLSMVIAGDSRVHIGDPASAAPAGFESLPQGLMPQVQVATASDSLADIARAVEILSELQGISSGLLRPQWVTVDELVNGNAPGLLVTSDGPPDELNLPLELTGGRTLEAVGDGAQEQASLRFYEDIDFASLQVVDDGGRAVMVASSTSGSAELDRTLDWLGSEPDRWGALRGNVLFTAPDRDPVELSTIQALAIEAGQDPDSPGVQTALVIGAVVAVASIALAGLAWVATKRGRSGRRP